MCVCLFCSRDHAVERSVGFFYITSYKLINVVYLVIFLGFECYMDVFIRLLLLQLVVYIMITILTLTAKFHAV